MKKQLLALGLILSLLAGQLLAPQQSTAQKKQRSEGYGDVWFGNTEETLYDKWFDEYCNTKPGVGIRRYENIRNWKKSGNYRYLLTKDKKGVTIVDYCGPNKKTLRIPSHLDGLPVVEIGVAAFYPWGNYFGCVNYRVDYLSRGNINRVKKLDPGRKRFHTIIVPEGVCRIASYSFSNCLAQKICLPESVDYIGEYAFDNCSIRRISLPENMNYIGKFAFLYCRSLRQIDLPEGIKEIYEETFYDCRRLKEIEIPSTVKSIGREAFYGCERLRKVTLHEGLQKIGILAFGYCKKLKQIDIPASVRVIGGQINRSCGRMTKIVVRGMNVKFKTYWKLAWDDDYPVNIWTWVWSLHYSRNTVVYGYPGSTAEKEFCKKKSRNNKEFCYLKPSLSDKKLSLHAGEKQKLVFYGARKKVTWRVGNTGVAEIIKQGGKEGERTVIRGKRPGTTKVRAIVEGKTYTCTVTVR